MKSPPRLFADITAILENLHGLAVEGQDGSLHDNVRRVLVADLASGVARLQRKLAKIGRRLDVAP
jgi:hypothetical protein